MQDTEQFDRSADSINHDEWRTGDDQLPRPCHTASPTRTGMIAQAFNLPLDLIPDGERGRRISLGDVVDDLVEVSAI